MGDRNFHHFGIFPDEQLYFKFLTHEENSPKELKVETVSISLSLLLVI